MRRTSAWSRSAGFTLIEALLATMLMLAILGAIASVTSQWMPTWDRGFVRLQRNEVLTTGLERLVSDLASAEIVSTGAGGPKDYPIFEGTELSVTFVRTKLGPNLSTGLEVVQIAETKDDDGLALVRKTAPFVPTVGVQRNFANPVVVVRPPYRVSFSYAGRDRVWRDNWSGSAQLPHAIRVRIRDAASSATLAVSTSILVHAELPVRCIGTRADKGCQTTDQLTNAGGAGLLER